MSRPLNISPVEWELALSMVRSICAEIFKKGGSAQDALTTFGVVPLAEAPANWKTAIDTIALAHCKMSAQQAA